jgi:membrane protease YdiL (CAAX protease family)
MTKTGFREIITSVLLIAFCFLFPHYSGFPIFLYPVIVLAIIWLVLKYTTKENFADLFFSLRRFEPAAIWIGIVTAILLSSFFNFLWDPVISKLLPNQQTDLSDFTGILHNPVNYAFLLLLGFIVGGFYEELVFHGLIFTRLEKILSGRYAKVTAFIISNLIFGAYHFQLGIKGVLLATVAGFAYHALIMKFKRNLWYGIFVHGFFDFIGLTFIYLGYL